MTRRYEGEVRSKGCFVTGDLDPSGLSRERHKGRSERTKGRSTRVPVCVDYHRIFNKNRRIRLK